MGKPGRLRTAREAPAHWLQRAAFAIACLLVVVVPLVWSFAGYEVFRGPKRELAMACWLGLAAVTVLRGWSRQAWRDPWWLAWAGVLAGALVSAPPSGEPLRVLAAAMPLAVVGLGWGTLRWLSPDHRRRLQVLVVVSGVAEALAAAAFSVPRWRPDGFDILSYLKGRYAWIGTFGNPADVALFLLLPCLLATARALASPGRRLRWAVPALGMGAAILATRTVSVVGALGVGLVILLWRLVPRGRRLAGLGAATALAAVALLASPMRARLVEVASQVRHNGWGWLGSGRAAGFGAALGMVAARPLTGVGFGLFEAHSYRFQSEDLLAERGRVLGLETGFGEAHNEVLQHTGETGLLGLGLAVAGLWLAWRHGRPTTRELAGSAALAAAAGLVSLFQFPLHQSAVAAQWAVLAALALSARPLPEAPAGGRRVLAAGVGLGLATLGWLFLWQLRGLSVLMRQAENLDQALRSAGAPQERVPGLARVALGNLERATRWAPFDWRAAVLMGDLAMLAQEYDRAGGHFDRALALAERPETHFNAGMVRMVRGERDEGLAHLERAVRLNPAIFRRIDDPAVAAAVRERLDAAGYSARHSWVYEPGK